MKSSTTVVSADHSMDDSLLATAMDGDSDDEQLIVGKKKQRSKSNAWIDEEAEDEDDDEFKGTKHWKREILKLYVTCTFVSARKHCKNLEA